MSSDEGFFNFLNSTITGLSSAGIEAHGADVRGQTRDLEGQEDRQKSNQQEAAAEQASHGSTTPLHATGGCRKGALSSHGVCGEGINRKIMLMN